MALMKLSIKESLFSSDIFQAKHYLQYQIRKMIVLGCGGTGSHLIPELAQCLAQRSDGDLLQPNTELILVDPDKVEEKNLIRQKFITADIGKPKAEVLAQRYSKGFGLKISSVVKEMKDERELQYECLHAPAYSSYGIIFGCVDNNASRQAIQAFIGESEGRWIWIDSGNEVTGGQVFVDMPYYHNVNYSDWQIPDLFAFYPEMKEKSKLNSELSCAERAVSAPQSRTVNGMAARVMLNIFNTLISGEHLPYFEVFFDTSNSVRTRPFMYKQNPAANNKCHELVNEKGEFFVPTVAPTKKK